MKKLTVVAFLVFIMVFSVSATNLHAAEQWWNADIVTVSVVTNPSLIYVIKVNNPDGPWDKWLNTTNKEILATVLTARTLPAGVTVRFENTTNEILELIMNQ